MALRFGSPRGASVYSFQSFTRGPRGPAATVQLGTVTELDPGEPPTVTNSGTDTAAVLNFGLPGTATVEVGDVTPLAPGSTPTVSNGGTPTEIELNFGLPTTSTISIGTVTTVDPSDPATVTNMGDNENIVLAFGIPQGDPGNDGEMAGPGVSVDGEIALYNGTSGTTLKRSNHTGLLKATAGVMSTAVSGTDYYSPGGTDVAITDGGTGASTASAAFDALKQAATDSYTGVVELATAAEVIAGSDTARAVTPKGIADAAIFGVIPVNSQSAAYTLVASDQSKTILHPAADNNARTFTIPNNGSVAFPIGTVITFVNKVNTLSIAITSDTLTWAPSGGTGTRSLDANGIATAIKIASTEWMITGVGLS